MSNYFECIDAVRGYLREQHGKGLVELLEQGPVTPIAYNAHAGTHREVVLPEVERLAACCGCKVQVSVDFKQCHDGSWVRIAWLSQWEEKDAYVQVCLVLCNAEEFTR